MTKSKETFDKMNKALKICLGNHVALDDTVWLVRVIGGVSNKDAWDFVKAADDAYVIEQMRLEGVL